MKSMWERSFYESKVLYDRTVSSTIFYWPVFPTDHKTLEDPEEFEKYKSWLLQNLGTMIRLPEIWELPLSLSKAYKGARATPSMSLEVRFEWHKLMEREEESVLIVWPYDLCPFPEDGEKALRILEEVVIGSCTGRTFQLLLNLENYRMRVKKYIKNGRLPWEDHTYIMVPPPPKKLPQTEDELYKALDLCFSKVADLKTLLSIIDVLKDLVDVYQGQIVRRGSFEGIKFNFEGEIFEFYCSTPRKTKAGREKTVAYDNRALQMAENAAKSLLKKWTAYGDAALNKLDEVENISES